MSSAPVIWFTGLSGSGKSTIAERVANELRWQGRKVEYLDGDAVRAVFHDSGFTRSERNTHLRRIGFMASRLAEHGVTVVASFVSPYIESREFVRGMCPGFFEVYISTPLHECERRDVKGLYARARRGEIENFTGISDPYEPPPKPELEINTTLMGVEESVSRVLAAVRSHAAGS